MTGATTKNLWTLRKALRLLFFLCHSYPCVLSPVHQHKEYGTSPTLFHNFPITSLSSFASRLQGIEKMFLIPERGTWELCYRLIHFPWQIQQPVFIFKAFVCLENSHSEKAVFSVFQRELWSFFGVWFLSFGKVWACSSVALEAWNLSSLLLAG